MSELHRPDFEPFDIREPEVAERLNFEHRDEYLRRREFLERTALVAGLGVGLATVLSPSQLVSQAAKAQATTQAVPTPGNMPIDTFVVVMMENRSFDHYLGWLPGADGRQAGLSYKDRHGKRYKTQPTMKVAPDFKGCAYPDPDHGWEGGRLQLAGGKLNGFLKPRDNSEFSISYYRKGELPFTHTLAPQTTVYDRYFCSLLGPTWPNRMYMHAATSYGRHDNNLVPGSVPDTTIFASLKAKGVDSRYFASDVPVSALWGKSGLDRTGRIPEYYERCASGTLPPVSYVDPMFAIGQKQGLQGDEHPNGDVRIGQAWLADVVSAFVESPQWKNGAIFVVYDEWGGFFDHVRPPRVPDDRSSSDINKDFGQMGFRIPAMAFSPYLRRGYVDHGTYGSESVLKMIEDRFGLAPLTKRDAHANSIAASFDFASPPRLDPIKMPHPAKVIAEPCAAPLKKKKRKRAAGVSVAEEEYLQPPPHDEMRALYETGYLDSLGWEYKPARPEDVFREPSKVFAAHKAAN